MKRTLSRAIALAFSTGILLQGCSVPEQQTPATQSASSDAAMQQPKIEFEKFELDNGLDVIFHIDRSDPVVAVALTSHVGSARETEGRTGFAHLFEHLLFLESENLGKGGLDKMSARIGGSGANGSTSRDRTNYFQTVPNDALEKMIWAEADKLGYFINTVSEPVLAKEKQVVKNEKRQGVDNRPYGHTQYVIDKNLYPAGHPYSWQVIGSLQDLQQATLDDVKTFFKRWYVPNNVTLVIAGDFDVQQAKAWVKKYFDEIPAGEPVVANQPQPANLSATVNQYYPDNFARLPELNQVWPSVESYHPDSYALDILLQLLSDGKDAPLNQVLVDEQQLTANVSMYHYQSELAGQIQMRVRAFDGIDLDKVNGAITTAFKRFETNGFSVEDLNRFKAGSETDYYQSLSSVLGKAFVLAQYNIAKNDPDYVNGEIARIQAVSEADIWRVYKQYLKEKPMVMTSFVPKGQVELAVEAATLAQVEEEQIVQGAEQSFDASLQVDYTRTPSSFDRTVEPPYGATPVIAAPSVWQAQLDNQMSVLGIENNEVPLVQFSLDIQGGMLFDPAEREGLANLTAEMLNRGTQAKSIVELEKAIDALGANINVSASRESIQLVGSTLARNFQPTMALLSEMLLTPRFDAKEFELAKQEMLSRIDQAASDPNAIADQQMNLILYGKGHPLANSLLGNKTSVAAITLDDVKNYYQRFMAANLSQFYVVGSVEQNTVMASLKSIEQQWPNKTLTLPDIKQPEVNKTAKLYFYDVPNAKQSVLSLSYPSISQAHPEHYAAVVMNYILGGGSFASQLTQTLREGKGYTYGIRSGFNGSALAGTFEINTSVRSNVTLEALELIKQIASDYQANFNQTDLDTTKSYFIKSNARRFETLGAKLNVLRTMKELQLPANYVQQRADLVEALSVDDVKKLAEKYLNVNQFNYLVVGDAATQLPRLKALGLGDVVRLN